MEITPVLPRVWQKYTATFGGMCGTSRSYFGSFIYSAISRAEPLTMLCGTLVGKHWPRERMKKATRNFSQDSRSKGWDFKLGPPEYGGVLPTRPRFSVTGPTVTRFSSIKSCLHSALLLHIRSYIQDVVGIFAFHLFGDVSYGKNFWLVIRLWPPVPCNTAVLIYEVHASKPWPVYDSRNEKQNVIRGPNTQLLRESHAAVWFTV